MGIEIDRRRLFQLGALSGGAALVSACSDATDTASADRSAQASPTRTPSGTPTGSRTRGARRPRPPAFDLDRGTVELNDGSVMPVLGIGTYLLSQDRAAASVETALRAGYRLVDTARIYGNEEGVGRGVVASGVARDEVFLTTKLWTADFGEADAAIDASLSLDPPMRLVG